MKKKNQTYKYQIKQKLKTFSNFLSNYMNLFAIEK